ncbi:3'-to-5' exoribonuclease RNase R [hydrothermal vent metagenome]|uniref:exoribonuclease II n=1 Tax=hydrothermal vent metagenome TaxID=652676 RepID=A0A3B0X1S5_9ZZZZ
MAKSTQHDSNRDPKKKDQKKNKKRHKKSHSKSGKPPHNNKSNKPLVDPQKAREASNYENPIASRELILQVVQEEGAMSHDHLLSKLKMETPDQKEALRRRLNAMVRDGQLIRNRRDGYVPVNEEDLISGRVIAHPDGFGFLVPDEGGDDLFLHGRQMRTLLHGDRAVVQVSGIDRRGRREGAVINVTERANNRIVGRLFIESGVCFVVADNKRITQDVMVPQDQLNDATHGQIVIVEITQQPTFRNKAIGKITDIVGDHMAPGMEIDIAIHAHNIPFLWPDDVKEQVKKIHTSVTESDKKGRVDLTQLPLVTIDGEDARDFDDAVYCEKTAKGWKLLVAIADVSHYVQRASALDEEAYNRATSVYFPERVIPMLPEVLSNGLCSLNPKVDRLCMVCEMHFNKAGKMLSSDFSEAVMFSHARLTYTQVSAMLEDNDKALRKEFKDVLPHLETLYDLYKALIKQRKKRGSIDFETTETQIVFDENKRIEKIVPTSRNEAHKIIEECMVSANIAAAKFIGKHKIPGLFRSHKGPKEEKIEDVKDFIAGVGLKFKRKGERLDYGDLINQAKGRPDFHLIQTVLLRSMQQAVYSPENDGHFGLSLENYAHFTSPIRRYPDLLVHRAIRHVVQGNKVEEYFYRESDMVHLGEHCSANERRADEATRDAVSSLKCEFMQARIGSDFKGTITSVTSFGIFIELNEIFVEGLVHITNLPKDYYKFEPVTHRLFGERTGQVFQLGDAVTINVAGVNMDERKIDFELLSHDENRKPENVISIDTAKKKKGKKKPSGKSKQKDKKKLAAKNKPAAKKPVAKKKKVEKEKPKKTTAKKKVASKKTDAKKKVVKKKVAPKKAAVKKKAVKKAAPKKSVAKKKVTAKKKSVKKVVTKNASPKKKAVKKVTPKKASPKKNAVKKVIPKKKVAAKKKAVKKVVPKKKVAAKKKAIKKVIPKKKTAAKKKAVKKVAPKKKVATKKKAIKKVAPKKKITPKKKVTKKAIPKKKVTPKKKAVKKVAPKKKVVKKVTPKKKAAKKKAKKK